MRPHIDEAPPAFMQWESVASLVGSRRTRSLVATPTTDEECRETIAFCRRHGLSLCPRGAGHSYGDICLNDQHVLLKTTKMDRILDFDEATGRMTVQPGVRILDIYQRVHHLRFTLPASPTESTITIAGAIASNVNGKDAWKVGNFCDQVLSLKLIIASGETISIDRDEDQALFRAVVGGLGLLGVVLEVTLQLRRVASPFLQIVRRPVPNLDALLEEIREVERRCDFAVVWLDVCAKGKKLGRGVIHATKWVDHEGTPEQLKREVDAGIQRLAVRHRHAMAMYGVMEVMFSAVLQFQRLSVSFFNRLYYAYSKLRVTLGTADNVEMFLRYNFDASFTVPPAKTVCGPHGYAIQVSIPREQAREAMTELIELCQAWPCPPATTIMRLHRRDDQLLSFCEDGYSLNFEIHAKKRHEVRMRAHLDTLFECVIRYGGKVHLAKEMVLTRAQFQRIFPAYEDFLAVKRRLDPDELFQSDLYRRLIRDAESGAAEAAPEIVVTAGEIRPAYAGAKGEAVGNEM